MPIANTKVCAVAGRMSAGANCANTLSEETEEMTLDQFLDFLEPREEPPKAPALCMSADDWNSMKTSLELACRNLAGGCSREFKQGIQRVDALAKGDQ